jgi:hypothetical protein
VKVLQNSGETGRNLLVTQTLEQGRLSPSMRRPVDVKAHFCFLLSVSLFSFSEAASVAILPSALFGERCSLGAGWVFSFQ